MLSEVSHTQKTNTPQSHLYVESKIVKFREAGGRMMISRGWEKGEIGK